MSTEDPTLTNSVPDADPSLPTTDLDAQSIDPTAADGVKGGVTGGGVVISGASTTSTTVASTLGLTGAASASSRLGQTGQQA